MHAWKIANQRIVPIRIALKWSCSMIWFVTCPHLKLKLHNLLYLLVSQVKRHPDGSSYVSNLTLTSTKPLPQFNHSPKHQPDFNITIIKANILMCNHGMVCNSPSMQSWVVHFVGDHSCKCKFFLVCSFLVISIPLKLWAICEFLAFK